MTGRGERQRIFDSIPRDLSLDFVTHAVDSPIDVIDSIDDISGFRGSHRRDFAEYNGTNTRAN